MHNDTQTPQAAHGQRVSRIIPSAVSVMSSATLRGPNESTSRTTDDRRKLLGERVNVLFAEMHTLKPFAFRKAWPTQERLEAAKAQYLAVREFRLLTDAQFKFGLDRLRATMVWPAAPSEFLELCREPDPEALGAPTLAEAYHQVMRYENAPGDLRDLSVMHPATYWAWRQLNHSVWRKMAASHLQLHKDLVSLGRKQDAELHLQTWEALLPRCELVVGETCLTHREVANA